MKNPHRLPSTLMSGYTPGSSSPICQVTDIRAACRADNGAEQTAEQIKQQQSRQQMFQKFQMPHRKACDPVQDCLAQVQVQSPHTCSLDKKKTR